MYERVHDVDNELRLQKTINLLNLKPVLYPLGLSLCNVFVSKTTESGLHCASGYYVFKYWHSIAVMLILYNIHILVTLLRRNNINIEQAP